jgi:hypothetical protein
MGNPLFQKAREAVLAAKHTPTNREEAIAVAKNALSSAFAQSTTAEKRQLHQLQDELDSL